jgi:hypothetical protein
MTLLLMGAPRYAHGSMEGFACLSPWFGVGESTAQMAFGRSRGTIITWKIYWIIAYTAAAFALLAATQRTFDRCFGRVQSRP